MNIKGFCRRRDFLLDTDKRTTRVEQCVRALRRRRRRLTAALYFLCAVLAAGLYLSLARGPGSGLAPGRGLVPGLYGATLLSEEAGGYVLMGVLAFAAGVALTVLCIRHREKRKRDICNLKANHTDKNIL